MACKLPKKWPAPQKVESDSLFSLSSVINQFCVPNFPSLKQPPLLINPLMSFEPTPTLKHPLSPLGLPFFLLTWQGGIFSIMLELLDLQSSIPRWSPEGFISWRSSAQSTISAPSISNNMVKSYIIQQFATGCLEVRGDVRWGGVRERGGAHNQWIFF